MKATRKTVRLSARIAWARATRPSVPSPALHLRAPLLWLLVPLMGGFTAARFWPPPLDGLLPPAVIAGGAGLISLWLAEKTGRWAHLGWSLSLTLAVALGGFALLHFRHPHLHVPGDRPPREITVTVQVEQVFPSSPQARSLTGCGEIVRTGEPDRDLSGCRVYFSVIRKISRPAQRSGRYVIRGVLEPLPRESGTVSFNDYLENLGIRQKLTRAQILREEAPPGWFPRFCSRVQPQLREILHHGLERHPAVDSLYVAMLLGEKAVLSSDQQHAFMRSGTFHIFSVSGLHVSVIAVALSAVLVGLRVPRRPAVVLSLAVLWLYVQVTGGSSPAVRSFVMIAFLLATQAFRVPGNGLAALSAAALVTLLLDPLQLFSTGFQMSYSVVAALIVMGVPLAEQWLQRWQPFALLPTPAWRWYHTSVYGSGRYLLGAGAACWTAFLASTPSGIGYFQMFSPGSLLANLLIIPLSSLALVGGFLSLLCGLAGLLSLSALFNAAAAITIIVMDWLVQHGAALPGVYFPARFPQTWMAPAALVGITSLMLAGLAGGWSRRFGGYWPPVLGVVIIIILGVKFG